MKNRGGMFTGWRQVFKFTATQNMKGTGFKVTTIGLAVVLFALFFAINCIMANSQLEESKKDADAVMDIEDTSIEKIFYICEDKYSTQIIEMVIAGIKDRVDIEFEIDSSNSMDEKPPVEEGKIAMIAHMDENVLKLDFKIGETSLVEQSDVEEFAIQFAAVVDNVKYGAVGLSQVQIAMINAGEMVSSEVIDVDDADEEKDMGIIIAEVVVPMIYSFAFYMIIALYCQSIQKLVVAEKTSKLMETLLTSVKPYAVILGKVLAMAVIGIGQTLIWLVGGVLGYIVGDKVALQIYPEYENIIGEIINLMKTDSGVAFTATGIAFALVTMILGYLVFCVLAGLSGALVGKIEDMSTCQMVFMIPIFIGFFASYIVPMATNSKAIYTVLRMVPIVSPFMVPAEFIIGKVSMLEGILSAVVMFATCFVLVVVTGKIYKNKVFNR